MEQFNYKYNIGDQVRLKPTHALTASVAGSSTTVRLIVVSIEDRRDNAGPVYKFKGFDDYYPENIIDSLYIG